MSKSNVQLFDAYLLLGVVAIVFILLMLGFGLVFAWDRVCRFNRWLRERRDADRRPAPDSSPTVELPSLAAHVDTTLLLGYAKPLQVNNRLTEVLGVPTRVIDTSRFRRLSDSYPLAPEEDLP